MGNAITLNVEIQQSDCFVIPASLFKPVDTAPECVFLALPSPTNATSGSIINMHRRFSSLVNNRSSGPSEDASVDGDAESKASTIVKDEELPAPALKVKRLDYYYSRWSKGWKYRVQILSFLIGSIG